MRPSTLGRGEGVSNLGQGGGVKRVVGGPFFLSTGVWCSPKVYENHDFLIVFFVFLRARHFGPLNAKYG